MDTASLTSLVEMSFVYCVVLGLAIWQLVSVRREIARDKAAAKLTSNDKDTVSNQERGGA